jgi:hypothetical protein
MKPSRAMLRSTIQVRPVTLKARCLRLTIRKPAVALKLVSELAAFMAGIGDNGANGRPASGCSNCPRSILGAPPILRSPFKRLACPIRAHQRRPLIRGLGTVPGYIWEQPFCQFARRDWRGYIIGNDERGQMRQFWAAQRCKHSSRHISHVDPRPVFPIWRPFCSRIGCTRGYEFGTAGRTANGGWTEAGSRDLLRSSVAATELLN